MCSDEINQGLRSVKKYERKTPAEEASSDSTESSTHTAVENEEEKEETEHESSLVESSIQ